MTGVVLALAALLGLQTASPASSLAACDELRSEDPDHWRGYTCYYVHARKTGAYAETIRRVEGIVAVEPSRTWARYILADLRIDDGVDGAAELYDEVSDEFLAAGEYESATLSRLAYAYAFDASGFEDIDKQIEAALEIAEISNDPNLLAQVKTQQARLLSRHGVQFSRVERLLRDARAVAFPEGPYELRKHVLMVEADLAQATDDTERALASLTTLLRLAEDQEDSYVSTSVQARIVSMRSEYPELRDARLEQLAADASAVDEALLAGNPWAHVHHLCTLGDLAADRTAAREHYQRCLSLATSIGSAESRISALQGLALAHAEDDHAQADAKLAEALVIAHKNGRPGLFPVLLKARLAFDRGDREEGAAISQTLLAEIDRQLLLQGSPQARARRLASLNPYYHELAFRLLGDDLDASPDEVGLALLVIERMRARMLIDALSRAKVEIGARPPELESLVDRMTAINRRLRSTELTAEERAKLLGQLRSLEVDEAALLDGEGASHSGLTVEAEIPTLQQIQAALEPDQAVLSFQMSRSPFSTRWERVPTLSWLAVITSSDVKLYPLPPREDVEPVVDLFAGLFVADASPQPMAAGLYEKLVAPAIEDLDENVTRLILVPDGSLHRLAFSVLGPEDGTALGQRFSLMRVPSLAVWARLRKTEPIAPKAGALALVDPTVGSEPASDRGSLFGAPMQLGRLPHAYREAESLQRVAATQIVSGAEATEAFFEGVDLSGLSIVHFAAHAVVDEAHPERASIILAPGSSEYDGLIQSRELARRGLPNGLVVLASCQGAAGPLVGSEGPLGLAHALFRGGARTVVAALWKIRDDDAARFFETFYERLGQGVSVSQAVAAAQRQLESEGVPSGAWAGIVVLGDGDFVPLPQPKRAWWLWLAALGGVLAALAAAWIIWRRRAGRRRSPA